MKMKSFRMFKESLESEPIESDKNEISFENAKKWIIDNYSEEKVIDMFDEAIHEYVDKDQMDSEGYESEYDYYVDYGNGAAQSDVLRDIIQELKLNFKLTFDPLDEDTDLYQFLRDAFDCLQF